MDTKQQHTAEPWKFRKAKTVTHIFNAARPIAKIGSGHVENPQDESNARRIVACVNACAGVGTDALEAAGAYPQAQIALHGYLAVKVQRDKLLEAVKVIASLERHRGTLQLDIEEMIELDNLIAEIEAAK